MISEKQADIDRRKEVTKQRKEALEEKKRLADLAAKVI